MEETAGRGRAWSKGGRSSYKWTWGRGIGSRGGQEKVLEPRGMSLGWVEAPVGREAGVALRQESSTGLEALLQWDSGVPYTRFDVTLEILKSHLDVVPRKRL